MMMVVDGLERALEANGYVETILMWSTLGCGGYGRNCWEIVPSALGGGRAAGCHHRRRRFLLWILG